MHIGLQAGLWGLLGASALVLGAGLAYLMDIPRRVTAGILSFGCGVLISAVAYDLIMEGFEQGGIGPIIGGALAGSAAYTVANWLVTRRGGRHRHRRAAAAGGKDAAGDGSQARNGAGGQGGSASRAGGLAIAVGALLDGIPESLVLGVGLLGGGVSMPMLAAIFLSNLPEGLASATDMREGGRSARHVLGMWAGVAALSALAAGLGAALLGQAAPATLATVNAVAAGALLTMIADTMIPQAVEGEHGGTGLLVVLGLLCAFMLSQGTGG